MKGLSNKSTKVVKRSLLTHRVSGTFFDNGNVDLSTGNLEPTFLINDPLLRWMWLQHKCPLDWDKAVKGSSSI